MICGGKTSLGGQGRHMFPHSLPMCKGMKNKAKKAISKVVRKNADEAPTMLNYCPNGMLGLVKGLKYGKEVEGESGGKLCFNEKEGGEFWNN